MAMAGGQRRLREIGLPASSPTTAPRAPYLPSQLILSTSPPVKSFDAKTPCVGEKSKPPSSHSLSLCTAPQAAVRGDHFTWASETSVQFPASMSARPPLPVKRHGRARVVLVRVGRRRQRLLRRTHDSTSHTCPIHPRHEGDRVIMAVSALTSCRCGPPHVGLEAAEPACRRDAPDQEHVGVSDDGGPAVARAERSQTRFQYPTGCGPTVKGEGRGRKWSSTTSGWCGEPNSLPANAFPTALAQRTLNEPPNFRAIACCRPSADSDGRRPV